MTNENNGLDIAQLAREAVEYVSRTADPMWPVEDRAINYLRAQILTMTGDYELVNRDDLRAHITAAMESAGAGLVSREAVRRRLAGHYLASIECDHERHADRPACACSLIDLGWHPTVGAAVNAWVDHVMSGFEE